MSIPTWSRRAFALAGLLGCAGAVAAAWTWRSAASAQEQAHVVSITGDHYAFEPSTIDVRQGDVVRVSFTARDMPHSFIVDEYRIAKRAGAGQTVTFEFRADRPGRFPFYCDLRADDGCRGMRGTLVVR